MIEIEVEICDKDESIFYCFDNMKDVEYFRRKMVGALGVPKEFVFKE